MRYCTMSRAAPAMGTIQRNQYEMLVSMSGELHQRNIPYDPTCSSVVPNTYDTSHGSMPKSAPSSNMGQINFVSRVLTGGTDAVFSTAVGKYAAFVGIFHR